VNNLLTPTEGARFLLEREQELDGGVRARYRAAVYTPETTFHGSALLADDGTVAVTAEGVPEELLKMLEMLARLTARSAAKKREDGLPPWPSRVLRWRGPGRGE
jgi:acylphosphatase